jgi:tRNA pseudouridine13 synthase
LKDISVKSIGFGDEPVHIGQLAGNKFKIIIRNLDKMPGFSPRFRNLFGEQRFSTKNADIGKHIVKREFEQAARTIAELFPKIQKVQDCIAKSDWVGALRSIPRKLLLLFVHSYQSFLWNKAALISKAENLPIVGFGSAIHDDVTKEIMREEGITPRDFVIKQLPEATAEGSERSVWAEAQDFKVGVLEDDEFFPGKKKVTVEFFLSKGSYATEFIRQSMN